MREWERWIFLGWAGWAGSDRLIGSGEGRTIGFSFLLLFAYSCVFCNKNPFFLYNKSEHVWCCFYSGGLIDLWLRTALHLESSALAFVYYFQFTAGSN